MSHLPTLPVPLCDVCGGVIEHVTTGPDAPWWRHLGSITGPPHSAQPLDIIYRADRLVERVGAALETAGVDEPPPAAVVGVLRAGGLPDRVIETISRNPSLLAQLLRELPAGAFVYEREPEPDPGAGRRRGARFGAVVTDAGELEHDDGPTG